MPRKEIDCVQPLCGRKTTDFYVVDQSITAQVVNAAPGPICSTCYESIVARATRLAPGPRKVLRGETE